MKYINLDFRVELKSTMILKAAHDFNLEINIDFKQRVLARRMGSCSYTF